MKVKRVLISAEFLFSLFSAGEHNGSYDVVDGAIPADAELVNVRHGWPHSLEILIRSESFEDAAEGQEIPMLKPVCLTTGTMGP